MRVRRNPDSGVLQVSAQEVSNSDLRSALSETRIALVNVDERMKSLEFRLQEVNSVLADHMDMSLKIQEESRDALTRQQFAQTMLLTFIAFTAGAGLFLTYFKERR